MKIQLFTQNIRPIGVQADSGNKYVSKASQTDSFERQNVAFKGAPTKVAEKIVKKLSSPAAQVVDEAAIFKEKVLAAIAKRGEEGLDELCKDLPTFRQTLNVLRDVLNASYTNFEAILTRKTTFSTDEKAIKALIAEHQKTDDAIDFWHKLTQEGVKTSDFIKALDDDANNSTIPLPKLVDFVERYVLIPKKIRPTVNVEETLAGIFEFYPQVKALEKK